MYSPSTSFTHSPTFSFVLFHSETLVGGAGGGGGGGCCCVFTFFYFLWGPPTNKSITVRRFFVELVAAEIVVHVCVYNIKEERDERTRGGRGPFWILCLRVVGPSGIRLVCTKPEFLLSCCWLLFKWSIADNKMLHYKRGHIYAHV